MKWWRDSESESDLAWTWFLVFGFSFGLGTAGGIELVRRRSLEQSLYLPPTTPPPPPPPPPHNSSESLLRNHIKRPELEPRSFWVPVPEFDSGGQAVAEAAAGVTLYRLAFVDLSIPRKSQNATNFPSPRLLTSFPWITPTHLWLVTLGLQTFCGEFISDSLSIICHIKAPVWRRTATHSPHPGIFERFLNAR